MDLETQLKSLEDDVKALKASFPVAGSKVKFYVIESQTFTSTNQQFLRIKFTPQYSQNKTLTTLTPKITIAGAPVGFEPFVNEPQDGTGAVVIKIQFEQYSSSMTYSVKIVASGTSPGTFSVI